MSLLNFLSRGAAVPMVLALGMLYPLLSRAEDSAIAVEGEVHVVGIGGGVGTGGIRGTPAARLKVDRPGQLVTLVLASYSSVTWDVFPGETTKIGKVILIGDGLQFVEGLPEGTPIENTYSERGEKLPFAHRDTEWRFTLFNREVCRRTGVSQVASFHGANQADVDIVIDDVQDNPKLNLDFPRPTPIDELPDIAKKLTFNAYYYVGNTVSFGEHTLSGPVEDKLRPLPGNVSRIAVDPATKHCYGVASNDPRLFLVDLERQTIEQAPAGKRVSSNDSLWEATFDSKRKRWIFGSYDLLQYSPAKNKWSPFSKRSCTLDALAYSKFDDRFYMVEFETHDEGDVTSLIVLDANGKVLSDSPLKQPIVPSRGWCHTSLIPLDGYLVMITTPEVRDFPTTLTESFTYLISLKTGNVWLTHRSAR